MSPHQTSKKRVLFVDDEVAVLDGLSNLLRKDRKRWEMVFAVGIDDALAQLAAGPFDVVVSDMRMPRMDGAELLTRVKDLYPAAARIVLSGHAEREVMLRALPVAHQLLGKPCDPEVLRSTIERICELQQRLYDPAIRAAVGSLKSLPSAPVTYLELTAAASRSDIGVAEIARIVERDPAISVKLLQLVNSAFFGLARRILSIQQAVSFLGIEMVRGLALTAQVFALFDKAPVAGFSTAELQAHALATARLARRMVSGPSADEAFTAALVHDVGKLVLAHHVPDKYRVVIESMAGSSQPMYPVEREILGVDHAQIGAYLLGVWGLPLSIIEAVAFHHTPSAVPAAGREVLAVVHAADCLMSTHGGGDAELDVAFLEQCGLADRLPAWRALAEEELARRYPA